MPCTTEMSFFRIYMCNYEEVYASKAKNSIINVCPTHVGLLLLLT